MANRGTLAVAGPPIDRPAAAVPPLLVTPERRIPVAGPSITAAELAAVADAAQHAWFGRAGDYVARFERAFADHCGTRHAVATPSCTAALHLAFAAAGIGPGDEVIVPDATWIASSAPLDYVGATPVFVDVDPHTWCLCPAAAARAITPRTKAILAVDLYGNLPDYERLRPLCDQHGLLLVEDAAEAVGSRRGDRRAGSFGHLGVFSFHGSKTLTTGEGGMLVTDDQALLERVRVLQDHGRRPGDRSFACDEVGFKYKMTDLQAALGLAQLARLDELVAHKRWLYAAYREALDDMPGLQWNEPGEQVFASYWMTTLVLASAPLGSRDRLRTALAERGIDSRPFFPQLSQTPAYRRRAAGRSARDRNPVAADLAPRGLNLPSAHGLDLAAVHRVAAVIRATLAAPHGS